MRPRLILLAVIALATACGPCGQPDGRVRPLEVAQPPRSGPYVVAKRLGGLALPQIARNLALGGDCLYAFINQGGLAVLDVHDPAQPVLANHLTSDPSGRPLTCLNGAVDGRQLAVADRYRGVTFFDLTDPLAPQYVETLPVPGDMPIHILPSGDAYWVSAGPAGLIRMKKGGHDSAPLENLLHDCEQVKETAFYPPHWLLAADSQGGLQILDASDPNRPRLAHRLLTGGFCDGVTSLGGFAAINNRSKGVMLLDLNKPENPWLLSLFPSDRGSAVSSMARWGERGLIVGWSQGFFDVLDLTHPSAPQWLGRVPTHWPVTALAVRGDLVYVALNRPPQPDRPSSTSQIETYQIVARDSSPPAAARTN